MSSESRNAAPPTGTSGERPVTTRGERIALAALCFIMAVLVAVFSHFILVV